MLPERNRGEYDSNINAVLRSLRFWAHVALIAAARAIATAPQRCAVTHKRRLLGGATIEFPVTISAEHPFKRVVNVPWRRVTAAKNTHAMGALLSEGE
ncbi:MAG: hypothetical protein CMF74_07695 [Maricaulis sp.]|nr:hypothetical protein [Maricaulis sp.]